MVTMKSPITIFAALTITIFASPPEVHADPIFWGLHVWDAELNSGETFRFQANIVGHESDVAVGELGLFLRDPNGADWDIIRAYPLKWEGPTCDSICDGPIGVDVIWTYVGASSRGDETGRSRGFGFIEMESGDKEGTIMWRIALFDGNGNLIESFEFEAEGTIRWFGSPLIAN